MHKNSCCAAQAEPDPAPVCYKTNSARKSLIHMDIGLLCFFDGHSSQSLDLQGFGAGGTTNINKVIHRILG
jgi:hypothetical protein